MKYPLAEKFKAPQGEGVRTGWPTAFMRLVGCSVGQAVCTACDTDFLRMRADLGGGLHTAQELVEWVEPYRYVCITGGEPFDRDLRDLLLVLDTQAQVQVETSGTKKPDWLDPLPQQPRKPGTHAVGTEQPEGRISWRWQDLWVTVSPKPGYLPEMVEHVADEIKYIHGGLGDGPGWPTLDDALRWADMGKVVYVQPRNHVLEPDMRALERVLALVDQHPQLRLSVQLHKFIRTR